MRCLKHALLAATLGLAAGLVPSSVSAEEHSHSTDHSRPDYHGRDSHDFHGHDRQAWHRGYWHHSWHNGRYGWWWFAGGTGYFYDAPVYPYPVIVSEVTVQEPATPPPPVPAPPAPAYYYCDEPAGYYPYVMTCSKPFRSVPVAPQSAAQPSPARRQSAP